MRISLIGLIIFFGGQLFGQTLFADLTKKTDSLNTVNYNGLKSTRQFGDNGKKTGFWTEYKLSIDTINSLTPVTIQGIDFSVKMEYQRPSTLEKIEGLYVNGQMTSQWKWFVADYYDDSLTWQLTLETFYVMGKKHGIEREYSAGQLFREASYSDNEQTGTEIFFYPPGVVFGKVEWKNGTAKNASWYYQDGKIKMKKDYKRCPMIKVTDYHENGKVKAKYIVLGDEELIDGEYFMFDINGKLIEKKIFDHGTQVNK